MTISFPPFTGETGYLVITYTLDGGFAESPFTSPPSVNVAACTTPSNCQTDVYGLTFADTSVTGTVSGLFSFSNPFTFTYGTPFELDFYLVTATGFFDSGTTKLGFREHAGAFRASPIRPRYAACHRCHVHVRFRHSIQPEWLNFSKSKTFFFGTRRLGSHDFVGSGFPATNSLCGAFPPCLQRPD